MGAVLENEPFRRLKCSERNSFRSSKVEEERNEFRSTMRRIWANAFGIWTLHQSLLEKVTS